MVFTPKKSVFYFALFAAFALAFVTHAETTENVEGTLISSESSGYGRKLMASTEDEVSEEEISSSTNWRLRIRKAQQYVLRAERNVISSRMAATRAIVSMKYAKLALGMRVRKTGPKKYVRKPTRKPYQSKRKPYQPKTATGSAKNLARRAKIMERRARSAAAMAHKYKRRVKIAISNANRAKKAFYIASKNRISSLKAYNFAAGKLRKAIREHRAAISEWRKAKTSDERAEARKVMKQKYKIVRTAMAKVRFLRSKFFAARKQAARMSARLRRARANVRFTKRRAYMWSSRAKVARRKANAAALAAKKAQIATNSTTTNSTNSTNSPTSL